MRQPRRPARPGRPPTRPPRTMPSAAGRARPAPGPNSTWSRPRRRRPALNATLGDRRAAWVPDGSARPDSTGVVGWRRRVVDATMTGRPLTQLTCRRSAGAPATDCSPTDPGPRKASFANCCADRRRPGRGAPRRRDRWAPTRVIGRAVPALLVPIDESVMNELDRDSSGSPARDDDLQRCRTIEREPVPGGYARRHPVDRLDGQGLRGATRQERLRRPHTGPRRQLVQEPRRRRHDDERARAASGRRDRPRRPGDASPRWTGLRQAGRIDEHARGSPRRAGRCGRASAPRLPAMSIIGGGRW